MGAFGILSYLIYVTYLRDNCHNLVKRIDKGMLYLIILSQSEKFITIASFNEINLLILAEWKNFVFQRQEPTFPE